MWHYFSDSIYKNSSAEFDPSDIVPRRSTTARDVTTGISTMVALEKAWHRKFSQSAVGSQAKSASGGESPEAYVARPRSSLRKGLVF